MTPLDPDLEATLSSLSADEEEEATYQLLAVTHEEMGFM